MIFSVFRRYKDIEKFRVVNGRGGDGSVEAYVQLINQDIVAVQSKWFPGSFGDSQINRSNAPLRLQ